MDLQTDWEMKNMKCSVYKKEDKILIIRDNRSFDNVFHGFFIQTKGTEILSFDSIDLSQVKTEEFFNSFSFIRRNSIKDVFIEDLSSFIKDCAVVFDSQLDGEPVVKFQFNGGTFVCYIKGREFQGDVGEYVLKKDWKGQTFKAKDAKDVFEKYEFYLDPSTTILNRI